MPKHINSFSGKNDKGFTLVEILVSLVILLILVVAFVPLFTFVTQAFATNKAKDIAIELATQKMEELRSLPYVVLDSKQQIDKTKAQLGNIDGNPPGSIPLIDSVEVNGRDYVVTTSITWGDETKSYKIVSVSVTAPGVFNEAVNITNRFDTMAAQEGIRVQPGSILVQIYNNKGELLNESISVSIETSDHDDLMPPQYTTNGEVLFDNLPSGTYTVFAQIPEGMTYHPDLHEKYDASLRRLAENEIIVIYNKQAKIEFIMDTPAYINLAIKDNNGNKIEDNNIIDGKLTLSWYESDPSVFTNIKSSTVTKNEIITDGQLIIRDLWPSGTYILNFKINKDITDSDFKLYNAYHNNDVKLNVGKNNMIANFAAPPVKLVLLGARNWVEPLRQSWPYYYVSTWADQSGNSYDATNTHNSTQPRFKRDYSYQNQLMFEDGDMFLNLPVGAECANNFTVFISAEPTKSPTLYDESNSSTNIDGTKGNQEYVLYPTQKNDDIDDDTADIAGMGISLGKNGITVFENGINYMPAKAKYQATISGYNVIAVKYYKDDTVSTNPTPSIYINGEHKRTGLPSNKATVYSPKRIGGDKHGYYHGNLRAVVIYGSPTLDDDNIKTVSQFLLNNYR